MLCLTLKHKNIVLAKVNLIENGPLVVVVEMTITHEDRTTDVKDTRASFCRCGKSENMPFCNGAHKGEL
ncbi:hypothetical protein ULMA_19080 [Patiriisocius marinus]|uniref:Iron-binding zinc finger CDGSH type domain-containing protein n=1 Tax=Patiriisocius marinus TaxID=1397112 RepID=A0A5J4J1I2_9FLAO|nr:hypothetical protein ULMA_19080 [Patiriisocius marinus]